MEKTFIVDKITLAHFGSFDLSANRYIDLFEKEDVGKIKIFIEANKYDQIKDIFLGINLYDKQKIKDKIEIHVFDFTVIDKVLFRLNFLINRITLKLLRPVMFLRLQLLVKKFLAPEDKVWIGENDYDNHNLFHCCLERLLACNFVVKNYKETRFNKDYFEKKSFELSNALIFPHAHYKDFFERLYGNKIFINNKLFYSDQDQRSRYHYQIVNSLDVTKYSAKDGKIHIAIIAGVVACEACSRSGNRYVIFNSILNLINCGFVVHLFIKDVIKSRLQPMALSESIYHDLERNNQNFVMSFEPMVLGSRIYEDIVRCDFGYLHDDVGHKNLPLFEFQKINIPNRYYEYLVADLIPIALKRSTFCYQNVLIEEIGIVLEDLAELNFINLDDKPRPKYVNDFPEVFLEAVMCPAFQSEKLK
tara:strand:+ start:3045 stop:4298 length:1254 start_codon:yes stop_codon:yes gene_type:complete